MISARNRKALWTLFLDVQKLVLWIPARFSIDQETRAQATALQLNLRVLNLYCVAVVFAVVFISVIARLPHNWPVPQTILILLVTIHVFKSIPVFIYLLFVNRKLVPGGNTQASD